MMGSGPEICVVCAWRESCQKKFSLSGRDIRCPDFVRDVTKQEKTGVNVCNEKTGAQGVGKG
jgi:hypothetical protein